MQKWLNDLYAILMKRGFITLDNSLKNYDKLDKQISKNVSSGIINPNSTVLYDIDNYESEVNDYLLIKVIFNDGKVAMATVLHRDTSSYTYTSTIIMSSGVNITLSGKNLGIVNNTSVELSYTLYINNI